METSGAVRAPWIHTVSGSTPIRAGETRMAISDGVLAWKDGIVTYAGAAANFTGTARQLDGCIVPGFVDCHTHLPFFGWRADEYEARLTGRTYRDLHGEGGIARSARMLDDATDDEAIAFCLPLLTEMAVHGTTTVELKTGYGLSVEAELRQARLARRLAAQAPQTCTVTLLACHAVPAGMDRSEWVKVACEELIPAAAGEGVVDAVDIYVEDIAFSLEDLQAVAAAAHAVGLPLRCHADQLGESGAAEAAVAAGARSADHLNHVSPAGVEALGTAETVAVLLPASTFMLGEQTPPVDAMRSAGATIAVSTDFNPGTSPVLSMPEALAIGCALYGLAPSEALISATANPAWVLDLHHLLGSLEPGKRADFLVLDTPDFAQVPYRPGHNPVAQTWIGGARAGATP